MGLDTTHGCWSGAYSAFNRWREEVAIHCGIPLPFMEGFISQSDSYWGMLRMMERQWRPKQEEGQQNSTCDYYEKFLPIKWDKFRIDPINILLDHSDCDGDIAWEDCAKIADRLEEILPLFGDKDGGGHIGNYREKTEQFIAGLRLAYSRGENVEFH